MRQTWRIRFRGIALVVGSVSLMACGNGVASLGPSPSGNVGTEAPPSAQASAAAQASGSVQPSAAAQASPSAADWLTLLTLLPCPAPRPTDPACLDAAANGEVPARTTAVHVGDQVRVTATVHNAATVASPPITLLFFTWEPPAVAEYLRVVACNGCTIDSTGTALEWPGLPPGDELLTATLHVVGRPTEGPVPGSTKVGHDYEWLAGFFPLPVGHVLGQPEGIDSGQAFALATGETTITK